MATKYAPKPRWEDWPRTGTVYAEPYGRLSKEDEDDKSLSESVQRRLCEQHIGRLGWLPGEWLFDLESGFRTEPENRANYQRLLQRVRAHIAAGHDVAVVTKMYDRFGRRLSESARAYEELEAMGARIYTCREGACLTFAQAAQLGAQAEQESRNTSDRIRDRYDALRALGWWRPAGRPWGYETREATDDETERGAPASVLVPCEAERPFVERAFAQAGGGASLGAIARWITTLPAEARGGREFHTPAVRYLLRNPLYAGLTRDGKPGQWPALLSPETWRAVQQRLNETSWRPAKQASGRYLLTGFTWCECGGRMTGDRREEETGRARRYHCNSDKGTIEQRAKACRASASGRVLEAAVERQLRPIVDAIIHNREAMDVAAELWEEERAGGDGHRPEQELKRLRVALAECEDAIGKLTADRRKPQTHPDYPSDLEYVTGRRRLATEHATVTAEIARVEAERPSGPAVEMTLGEALARVGSFGKTWDAMTTPERREAMAELVTRVEPIRNPDTRRVVDAHVGLTIMGEALASLARDLAEQAANERTE